MDEDPELRRALWFLLGGKRGGVNRARIIFLLRDRPSNLNQMANDLQVQYKTIQHHIKILLDSSLVVTSGEGYGSVYSLSPWFEAHIDTFDRICMKLGLTAPGTPAHEPTIHNR